MKDKPRKDLAKIAATLRTASVQINEFGLRYPNLGHGVRSHLGVVVSSVGLAQSQLDLMNGAVDERTVAHHD